MAKDVDAVVGHCIEVAATVGVPQVHALAPYEGDPPLGIERNLGRRLDGHDRPFDDVTSVIAPSALAIGAPSRRRCVPPPLTALWIGFSARASARMTRGTPRRRAAPQARTFFFIRPCANETKRAMSSSVADVNRLSGWYGERKSPGVLEKMSNASARSATANSIASLSPSTLMASPS